MTHSTVNSTHYSNSSLHREFSLTVIPTKSTLSIPNKFTQCTVGADNVTFLRAVHSVLLVLTLLYS